MLDRILGLRPIESRKPAVAGLFPIRAKSGITVDEDTALTYSAVFSAVKVISETVAMLPWRVYASSDGRRTLLAGTPVDTLLHRAPNSEITAFQFREYLTACGLLHGNAYAEIEWSRSGDPIAMHPLPPDAVTVTRDESGRLTYAVKLGAGASVNVPAGNMFHLRGPTKDGLVGRSVINLAAESWGLGLAAEQFAGAFFGNGAIPSLFIEQGEDSPNLSEEGARNMLESFERRHRGAGRAGKTALLERGFTVKAVGIPQRDAQFLETRKFSVSDVARWFRVPPHKIGDLERSTFSNIESQETSFVNDAIMPWAIRYEQEANFKLITDDGAATKLDARGLMRGDSTSRAEYYTKMRDLGAYSINEIRELEDMDPIDGGDLRLVPLNMVSVQRAASAGGTDSASAMRGVLLDAHDRMITKESRAIERARDSGKDLSAWVADFYARHEPQLRDALTPGALAIGSVHDAGTSAIAGVVESHCRLHCEVARAMVAAGGHYGPTSAAEQTDKLIGLIVGVANAT